MAGKNGFGKELEKNYSAYKKLEKDKIKIEKKISELLDYEKSFVRDNLEEINRLSKNESRKDLLSNAKKLALEGHEYVAAELFRTIGAKKEGVEYAKKIAAAGGSNFEFNNTAMLFAKLGARKEAIEYAKNLIKRSEHDFRAYNLAGRIFAMVGARKEAIECSKKLQNEGFSNLADVTLRLLYNHKKICKNNENINTYKWTNVTTSI